MRQWTWQYCTEFGFFQTPNSVFPLRSAEIDYPFWIPYCKAIFGKDIITRSVATNKWYGALNIPGSNIYFANAGEDPW